MKTISGKFLTFLLGILIGFSGACGIWYGGIMNKWIEVSEDKEGNIWIR